MQDDAEKRRDRRFEHETPIVVQDRRERQRHRGMMVNFSKEGIYIETDFECHPGEEIEIVVEDPPYGRGPFLHRAEVVWTKELAEAVVMFRFGCGAHYTSTVDYSVDRSDFPLKKRSGRDRRSGFDRRNGERRRRDGLFSIERLSK